MSNILLLKHYVIKPSKLKSRHRQVRIVVGRAEMPALLIQADNDVLATKVREPLGCVSHVSQFLYELEVTPMRHSWIG